MLSLKILGMVYSTVPSLIMEEDPSMKLTTINKQVNKQNPEFEKAQVLQQKKDANACRGTCPHEATTDPPKITLCPSPQQNRILHVC